GVVDLFLHSERTLADAAVAEFKTRLLEEVLFLPHRQLVLLRQANRNRRADLLAAAAKNAASKIKLPGQLAAFEIGFHRQRVGRAGVDAGRAADALLRVVLR